MKALRQVQDEEIERLCQEFNFASWAEVSVKDNAMVDDCMKHLVSSILSHERMEISRPHDTSTLKLNNAEKEKEKQASNGCKLCRSS